MTSESVILEFDSEENSLAFVGSRFRCIPVETALHFFAEQNLGMFSAPPYVSSVDVAKNGYAVTLKCAVVADKHRQLILLVSIVAGRCLDAFRFDESMTPIVAVARK